MGCFYVLGVAQVGGDLLGDVTAAGVGAEDGRDGHRQHTPALNIVSIKQSDSPPLVSRTLTSTKSLSN